MAMMNFLRVKTSQNVSRALQNVVQFTPGQVFEAVSVQRRHRVVLELRTGFEGLLLASRVVI